jgi:membrane protein YdbS with pleckstrin-like domain
MKFRSAISWGLFGPIGLLLTGSSLLMINSGAWVGILINALVAVLIIWLYKSTYYIVSDHEIIIRSGPFFHSHIPFESIRSVRSTSNPLSAPAFSLKRIQIDYGKNQFVIISPHTREEFMKALEAAAGCSIEKHL